MVGSALNEHSPSGLVLLGPGRPSTSSTGARSMAIPAWCIWWPTADAVACTWAGVMVWAISRAHGNEATKPASRCTPPPSSSAMVSGGTPPGATLFVAVTCRLRSAGGGALPRKSTPPTPVATVEPRARRLKSSDGITISWAARRANGHDVASQLGVVVTGPLGGPGVVGDGGLDA